MIVCYSGRSKPSALKLAEQDEDITLRRSSRGGDINWGRSWADTVLNPDITNSTNKRVMRELFKEHDVPMPKLLVGTELFETIFLCNKKVVGRPDHHMKGRGFWLCRSLDDVDKALRGTRRKAAATHFMEYIESDHEYRVHIFNGKSIRISEKQFTGQDGNHKEYVTVKPTDNVNPVRRAAKMAVKALGLDFGAVDILVDSSGNPYVLEVNAAPGLGGTLPRLYAETFKGWYEDQ